MRIGNAVAVGVDAQLKVLRAIVLFPEERATQLRIECRQGSFDAKVRIGVGDRRVVHCGRLQRSAKHKLRAFVLLLPLATKARLTPAQRAHHFAVFQGDSHSILQR
jgi:hypothetical protein